MENNIPTWTKKQYILSGYREQNNNSSNYFISILKIHNESINIWTHLLSLLYFLHIIIKNNSYDNVILLYDFIAALCFFISIVYHVYMPYSENNYLLLLQLDLYSIILNITISNILVNYYWFWCYDNIRHYFMILSTIYLGVGSVILLKFNVIKIYDYILVYYGLYNIFIPLSYIYIYIITNGNINIIIIYDFSESLIYFIIGFAIYLTKIPEILFINKFDIIGNSHQLWHIFSSIGIYYFHEEIIKNREYRLFDNCYQCLNNVSEIHSLTSKFVI
tara:strand:- start:4553 stop:5380 length:828 start_codon:yes stop_codon:yes gene_type:complete